MVKMNVFIWQALFQSYIKITSNHVCIKWHIFLVYLLHGGTRCLGGGRRKQYCWLDTAFATQFVGGVVFVM